MAFDTKLIHAAMFDRVNNSTALDALNVNCFTDKELKRYGNPTSPSRPTLPWVVYTYDAIGGTSNNMRVVNAGLWAYIDPDAHNTALLYDIQNVLDTLFGSQSKHALSALYGELSVVGVGKPTVDNSLGGLLGLVTRIQFSRRG